jgi:phage terminase large subunit-like protein
MIERAKSKRLAMAYKRIVVGVDPSGSDGETGDQQGIIVAGQRADDEDQFDVLADRSIRGGPDEWGKQVINAMDDYYADLIVAERNFGGEMVRHVIQTVRANAPVKVITASRAKHVRAEPIAALYEQNKVAHTPGLGDLEEQMTAMTTNGYFGDSSPDRLDGLVWALSELSQTVSAEVKVASAF